jgi:hypothetical protein
MGEVGEEGETRDRRRAGSRKTVPSPANGEDKLVVERR